MANFFSNVYNALYQVCRGLKTVSGHTFREPITQNYPEVAPDLAAHFRGRLALAVNPENGEHLCISCRQCERVCPDKCIEITAHKSPQTNKLELIDFKIDHGLCMFCGLCTEVCPTACIINTKDFEMADYTREALVYDLKKLTLTQEESGYYFDIKEVPLPKPKPAKPAPGAAPAAGAAAAAKPAAGSAAPLPNQLRSQNQLLSLQNLLRAPLKKLLKELMLSLLPPPLSQQPKRQNQLPHRLRKSASQIG